MTQCLRICACVMRELAVIFVPAKRACWQVREAFTRSRIAAEDSPGFFVAEFGERECRCLDVQVDAVEERAADVGAVALHLHGRAAALALRVTEIAARAKARTRGPALQKSIQAIGIMAPRRLRRGRRPSCRR